MFKSFREWCERVLRIPGDPEPPPGDEARTQRFRAAPNYYKYLLALWGLKTAALLVVLVTMELGPLIAVFGTRLHEKHLPAALIIGLPQLVILFFLVGRLLSGLLVRLDFEKRWYLVTDRSLRLREGILNVREMTITFANIQNISISQGPIQRALGIADLRVDTAGGSAPARREHKGRPQSLHTAFFRGVDNANAIRELIQTRLRELKDSGLGDHEEAIRAAPMTVSSVPSMQQLLPVLREVAAEARMLREAIY
ncbi:MAG TPA: PH domain-containing protein [Chthoniobacterales bacterium]